MSLRRSSRNPYRVSARFSSHSGFSTTPSTAPNDIRAGGAMAVGVGQLDVPM
jgi:hypothetical protein